MKQLYMLPKNYNFLVPLIVNLARYGVVPFYETTKHSQIFFAERLKIGRTATPRNSEDLNCIATEVYKLMATRFFMCSEPDSYKQSTINRQIKKCFNNGKAFYRNSSDKTTAAEQSIYAL
jgi:hypothetical protein